jgi:hypothetical protein
MTAEKRMTVKGAGPLALSQFIKTTFPDRFDEWIRELPPESRRIHENSILAFEMYPMYDALIAPIEKMCGLFYRGDERGAWETGRHSAGFALKGFYKVFFRFGSPQFIIDRAARVFSSYYPEGVLSVAESSSGRCVLRITAFPEPYRLIENNIAGWVNGVLELLDRKVRTVDITKRMSDGDPVTEFIATWK